MIHSLIRQHDTTAPAYPETYLARLYANPNPYRTREAFDRFYHLDVPTLTDDELGREIRGAQRRLDYEPDAARAAWLTDRLTALQRERARRAGGPVHHAR